MLRKQRVQAFALFCTAAAFSGLWATPARAALPLVVTDSESMDGIRQYTEVTVKAGGSIRVKPLGTGVGFLHLRANRIVIEMGGSIDASGAGFQGVDGANGDAQNGSDAGGKVGLMPGDPGTGGANAGNGGRGTTVLNGNCSAIQGLNGGQAYMMPSLLQFGGAGGAFQSSATVLSSRGGAGGGRITLEAAEIHIAGLVAAKGQDGIAAGGTGSGGGAGGAVEIRAGTLTGDGTITVRGGYGGEGVKSGGGGGGGVILINTSNAVPMTLNREVGGGLSGSCQNSGKGAQGTEINETTFAACPDIDMDSHTSAVCGGTDCDDSDPGVHPSMMGNPVYERCDGQDNDCNGMVDDNLPEGACAAGYLCEGGACVEDPAGQGGKDAGAPPDRIEYQGGCAASGSETGKAWISLLGLVGLLMPARRISRRAMRSL